MPRTTITEAAAGAPTTTAPGRIKVGLITPGWGSSGHYSPQVLENAVADKVWPKGTHVFFDHPSESELYDRPERSVRDLAAVLSEDARLEDGGLVAEADVIGPYRDLVTDPVFAEAVGMSIRSTAETTTGEAEGRKGTLITRLVEGQSVDLVTRAGRGGKVLAVLESARAVTTEALTRETKALLEQALGERAYVIDFDPEALTVVYRREWEDDGRYRTELVRDGYSVATDGLSATLNATPEPVRQVTTFVPATPPNPTDVPAPAGQSTTTQESKEDTMPQIEESRLAQLEADAGRVQTAETERDTARSERDAARTELTAFRARENARPAVTRAVAESGLPARRQARIIQSVLDGITVGENGTVDTDAVVSATNAHIAESREEIAELAESLGVGKVTGFGSVHESSTGTSVEDFDTAFATKEA